jgi:3-carboxy-cis,cis-muconate cycloisomerase
MDAQDIGLLSPGWVNTGADTGVSDLAWVQAMLDVEVALAVAQARVGIIPPGAVEPITLAATLGSIDVAELAAGVRATANPVVSLVGQLTRAVAAVDREAANHVHRGSTSQDILDSAMMLLSARVLDDIERDLTRCATAMAGLAEEHRDTPMVGRTLTQHAVPITFGLKAAGWLQLVLDALERVHGVRGSLPASIGGAAGTLSAYQEYATSAGAPAGAAVDLIAVFAAELGLREPLLPWHGIRTPLVDIAVALIMTTGALGKFAADVQVMTRTEIGEVFEPAAPGRGASSAMPQKHNPVFATLLNTAARQLPAYAQVLFQSVAVEDERSAGGWHAEWQPLRECLRLAGGAAVNAAELAEGLVPVPGRMWENLALTDGAVVSERLTAALAPHIGKAAAKSLLTDSLDRAALTGVPLVEVLDDVLLDGGHSIGSTTLAGLLDPAGYTGVAALLVDRVLARHRAVLSGRARG